MRTALARTPGLRTRAVHRRRAGLLRAPHRPAERYAARFAAKEAVMKALGVGLGAFELHDVEVARGRRAAPPSVLLTGGAARAWPTPRDRAVAAHADPHRTAWPRPSPSRWTAPLIPVVTPAEMGGDRRRRRRAGRRADRAGRAGRGPSRPRACSAAPTAGGSWWWPGKGNNGADGRAAAAPAPPRGVRVAVIDAARRARPCCPPPTW